MPAASARPLSRLKALREKAGISQRELARLIDVHHSNVSFWERTGRPPRSEVLPQMAGILGVSVDELLGQTARRKLTASMPRGKMRSLFEAATRLPRSQQDKIVAILEPFLREHAGAR